MHLPTAHGARVLISLYRLFRLPYLVVISFWRTSLLGWARPSWTWMIELKEMTGVGRRQERRWVWQERRKGWRIKWHWIFLKHRWLEHCASSSTPNANRVLGLIDLLYPPECYRSALWSSSKSALCSWLSLVLMVALLAFFLFPLSSFFLSLPAQVLHMAIIDVHVFIDLFVHAW